MIKRHIMGVSSRRSAFFFIQCPTDISNNMETVRNFVHHAELVYSRNQSKACIHLFDLFHGLVGLHQFCGCTKLPNVSRLLDYRATCKKSQLILLTDLISISHKHLKKLLVFVGDQNKQVISWLESNIDHKILILYTFTIKCKY